jgi:hypothetical protein
MSHATTYMNLAESLAAAVNAAKAAGLTTPEIQQFMLKCVLDMFG